MAAPTPISALVHSSTLVTAGVYVLLRVSFPSSLLQLLALLGLVTSTLARLTALVEIDRKKIIALSTLRQLGVIVAALGRGLPEACFLHLLVHAFFKSLMFISVGGIIHISSDFQDSRAWHSLSSLGPLTFLVVGICGASLRGLPFTRGIYSKDFFVELTIFRGLTLAPELLLFTCILLTPLYTVRLLSLLLGNPSKLTKSMNASERRTPLVTALVLIAPWAAIAGSLLNPSIL